MGIFDFICGWGPRRMHVGLEPRNIGRTAGLRFPIHVHGAVARFGEGLWRHPEAHAKVVLFARRLQRSCVLRLFCTVRGMGRVGGAVGVSRVGDHPGPAAPPWVRLGLHRFGQRATAEPHRRRGPHPRGHPCPPMDSDRTRRETAGQLDNPSRDHLHAEDQSGHGQGIRSIHFI